MKLNCLADYKYGLVPKLTTKQAKDNDFDPKVYHGGPVQVFEAGKTYDVESDLARRLLRDFGPKRNRPRTAIKFTPANQEDLVELLMSEADKVTLRDVLDRGFVVEAADEDEEAEVEVSA